MESFAKFEHERWQRVAGKYDSVQASAPRQFVPPLLDAVEVSGEMSVLDVGCGPGYVSTRFPFDASQAAGVRTAGLLARQRPAKLHAIQSAIEESFVATPRATALPFPPVRTLSRRARRRE